MTSGKCKIICSNYFSIVNLIHSNIVKYCNICSRNFQLSSIKFDFQSLFFWIRILQDISYDIVVNSFTNCQKRIFFSCFCSVFFQKSTPMTNLGSFGLISKCSSSWYSWLSVIPSNLSLLGVIPIL